MPESAKRIVLVAFGSPGDLQPFLAVGEVLRDRGHEPVIATSEFYRELVSRSSLEFASVRPERFPGQKDPDYLDRLLRRREPPARMFREMFLPGLRDSVADLLPIVAGADGVVTHTLAAGGRLAAEAQGIPWLSAVMQPMAYLSAHEPPVIGPSWLAAALRAAGPDATRHWHRTLRRVTVSWTRDWHLLRHELGLPSTSDDPLWEGQHSPLRSLGLFSRVLGAPQADWPQAARITGFPFYRSAGRRLDPVVQRFIEEGDAPLVFTLGTTAVHDPGAFYEESAAAAEALGLRAVLISGPRAEERPQRWSRNILETPFAEHHLLFPHALAVVHQGGIGTLSEALLAGKPMLIMPYGHDQADNAWRASRLGSARIIARGNYREQVVRRAISRLLSDATPRTTAVAVSLEVARERGADVAADHIARALA